MRASRCLLLTLAAAAARRCAAAPPSPPCTSPLNPALESICFSTITRLGNFSIREYASGLNVALVTSTAAGGFAEGWAIQSQSATTEALEYFLGANSEGKKVPLTVPLIYRPQGQTLLASLAIPTSVFPSAADAPRPTAFSALEPFPAIRVAALTFVTPALASDVQYAFACGELQEVLALQGLAPVDGPWSEAWVTYSGRAAPVHVNECWAQVKG